MKIVLILLIAAHICVGNHLNTSQPTIETTTFRLHHLDSANQSILEGQSTLNSTLTIPNPAQYEEHRSLVNPLAVFKQHFEERPVSRAKDLTPPKRQHTHRKLQGRWRGGEHGAKRFHKHNHHRSDYYSLETQSESDSNEFYFVSDTGDEAQQQQDKQTNTIPFDPNGGPRSDSLINYILYSPPNNMNGVLISENGVPSYANWLKGRPLKVVIHGYFPNTLKTPTQTLHQSLEIVAEYLKGPQGYNIIVCNWTAAGYIMPSDFFQGPLSILQIGANVASLLQNLKGTGRIATWEDVHIIGFSLGAHIAGVAGFYIQKYNGGLKPNRITGLDPANAGFDTVDGNIPQQSSGVLDRSDADFVDIIHCNQGSFANNMFGTTLIAGHADFYPNNGERQPICGNSLNNLCSHEHCQQLYINSIKTPAVFKACQCPNWTMFVKWHCDCANQPIVLMGDSCTNTARGLYFLRI